MNPIDTEIQTGCQPLVLSAPTPDTLAIQCQAALTELESADSEKHYQKLLENSTGSIPENFARMGFVCHFPEEAAMRLRTALQRLRKKAQESTWTLRNGIHYRREAMPSRGKVVALFSGQGSQYLRMIEELHASHPSMAACFSAMDALFEKEGGRPLSSIVFPPHAADEAEKKEQETRLTLTEHAQPAIGTTSAGLYKILQSAGLKVDATVGHSFGEVTALWAGGVFSDSDYFFLAKARGKAMAAPKNQPGGAAQFERGGMLAVKAKALLVEEEARLLSQTLKTEITVANLNSDKQSVLAGPKKAILQANDLLKEKGYTVVLLPVSAAFHTSLMEHARKPFAAALREVQFRSPEIPIYSNTTGSLYPKDPQSIRAILEEHVLKPVLFKTEIENTYQDGGRIYIEFGPKSVLTALVSSILAEQPHATVALNGSPKKNSLLQLQEGLLHLRVLGLQLKN